MAFRFEPLRDQDIEILRHPLDLRELCLLELLLSCEAPRGFLDCGRLEDQLDNVVNLLDGDIDRVLVEVGEGLMIDGDLWLRSLLIVLVGADERGLRIT